MTIDPPTKIIFLDVDGVLNSSEFFDRQKDPECFLDHDVDPKAVEVLNTIVARTGAKVVISSTWRICHYDLLLNVLNEYKFFGHVIGKTPKRGCSSCLRGNEILDWMKDNEGIIGRHYYDYKNYVILDDDSDMLYWQKDNFVKTDNRYGLLPSHIDQIVEILNQE